MLFSKKLKKFTKIKHCFFSRKNGFSKGIFESLNCGLGSKDSKLNVLKNLSYVSNKIGCEQNCLITLNQHHSNNVVYFDNMNSVKNKISADAIITKIKSLGIAVLTADCAPILFYDYKKNIIGCVHAGWKGAFSGIIENTVKKFNELDSLNENLIAVVGPCIGKKNYEVKKEFYEKFVNKNSYNENFFEKVSINNFLFDLRGFINKKISNLNIKNVENIDVDTFSDNENFYSYRRSLKHGDIDYGRCISVILMT